MSDPTPASPFAGDEQARFERDLDAVVARYPSDRRRAAMIPALRMAQERLGHLSPEAMAYVASRLGVSAPAAQEVATFYSMLHTEPRGRHLVDVCTNVSCSVRGAEGVLKYLEKKLGIHAGRTTPDQRITLREVECLASCGTAPCLQIDEDRYVENVTPPMLDALLEKLA